MKTKRLSLLLLLIAICVSFLFTGCTVNINVGNPSEDTAKETAGKSFFDYIFKSNKQYESHATIYVNRTTIAGSAISSSDLAGSASLLETYSAILQSNGLQSQIREKYPEVEYTLSLDSLYDTEVFEISAIGENPEFLEDICNMAASLLCEKITQISGVSCRVIDNATTAQLVR